MRAVCIDDERLVLEELLETLKHIDKFDDISGYTDSGEALDYLKQYGADIIFLDINMGDIDGIELARCIKGFMPQAYLVFTTGYSEYALEAFQMHVDGYLLKPVTETAILEQLNAMYTRVPLVNIEKKHYRIQTFGNFEFYIDGKRVEFICAKAKELLAYIADRRGATVSVGEAAGILFGNSKNDVSAKAGVRNAVLELRRAIGHKTAEELLIKKRSTIALNTALVDCDYYRMLDGDRYALDTYMGEYMSQYRWADTTQAGMTMLKDRAKGTATATVGSFTAE